MIYQGPNLISEINIGIAELLRMDGFKSIEEAVGSGINKRHLHRHAK
jgi:dihydroorotate dehydrogenase